MKRLLLLLALILAAAPATAQEVMQINVKARLLAEGRVAPGGAVTIALEQDIRPGWHTYWVNPGQVGEPTTITWTLPAGWKAGPIQWAAPKRLPVGSFMDYGYEGKVWLLTNITAPADANVGETVTLKAAVSLLVCEKVCEPEDMTLNVPVTVGEGSDATLAADFAKARAQLPVASPWKTTFARGTNLDLYLAAPALVAAHPAEVQLFPLQSGAIKDMAEQHLGYAADGLVLRLTPGEKPAATLDGVLVLTSADKSVQAIQFSAPQGPVPSADFGGAAPTGSLSLWAALFFAFLGGLILNVMPCVLPILAMKALALARHRDAGAVAESLAYAGGVILSFAALGLALVVLRAGGAAVGWGFQLQSPVVVAGFALLVFAVGLNLSGVFEVGSITTGESLTHKGGAVGAFFTGVLAVAVAAPCTAPFMAPALGFALTQNAGEALAIFIALGLGFALPFLLLGLWPRALAFIPRPGSWMLRFKQFLAFPMYGAAAWLAWVLAVQAGANSLIFLFAAMVILALGLWLWSATRDLVGRGRIIGLTASILLLLGSLAAIAQLGTGSATAAAPASMSLANAEPYSPDKLAQLQAAGRPVLIDATAAWCITCLVNEQTTLSRPSVQAALKAKNVALLVADWTNRNAEIAALLTANGRSGVPLYLYYAPGAATPMVLPQILTESIVTDIVSK